MRKKLNTFTFPALAASVVSFLLLIISFAYCCSDNLLERGLNLANISGPLCFTLAFEVFILFFIVVYRSGDYGKSISKIELAFTIAFFVIMILPLTYTIVYFNGASSTDSFRALGIASSIIGAMASLAFLICTIIFIVKA